MDNELLYIIILVTVAVCVAIVAWLISFARDRKAMDQAREWIPTPATIESGTLEPTHETNKVVLPTFTFSYQVASKYYSGRFSLKPKMLFPSKQYIDSLINKISGRRILVRYDPQRPEAWFIPDELIENCCVEQKIGTHLIHTYYPRD